MPDVIFHYTSRHAAQEIVIAGLFKPGRSGRIYVTEDIYADGSSAARWLAVRFKPLEMTFVIPLHHIAGLSNEFAVEPILAPDGTEVRAGGGAERWTEQEFPVNPLVAWALAHP